MTAFRPSHPMSLNRNTMWTIRMAAVALGVAMLSQPSARVLGADDGFDDLFGKRERTEAGLWRLLEEPRPGIVDVDLDRLEPLVDLESLSLAFAKKLTDDGLVH